MDYAKVFKRTTEAAHKGWKTRRGDKAEPTPTQPKPGKPKMTSKYEAHDQLLGDLGVIQR